MYVLCDWGVRVGRGVNSPFLRVNVSRFAPRPAAGPVLRRVRKIAKSDY